ncbi:MAG: GNAT family N-acetyltransferase [Anaerolineae bacterium]
MTQIEVRPATLDDVLAITAIHCSDVDRWRDPTTREVVAYEDLSLYGRWRNGGPWMSVESCAVHLNALLRAGHIALVAEMEGAVVGEAEYYVNVEPEPYTAFHLSVLYVHRDWQGRGIGGALLEAGLERAKSLRLPQITTQPDEGSQAFYAHFGFNPWRMGREMQLLARGAPPLGLHPLEVDAGPPATLALRIGRYQCGVQGWEALWPTLVLPGWSDLRRWVWSVDLENGPAILGLREQLTDATQADGYAWLLPEVDLAPAVAALRALAHLQGFGAVDLLLPSAALLELRERFRLDYQSRVEIWLRALE